MARKGTLNQLNDLFIDRKNRLNNVVYFIRICSYSNQVDAFLKKCTERAMSNGALVDGKLSVPDVRQISYYQEIVGDSFEVSMSFIDNALNKWLKTTSEEIKKGLAASMFFLLAELKKAGKNENVLKNAFIKYMCWLYYKFVSVLPKITLSDAPVILYDGEVGIYEIHMLDIMNSIGCDVVLVQKQGDDAYNKLDPQSRFAQNYAISGGAFPADYGLKAILASLREKPRSEAAKSSPSVDIMRGLIVNPPQAAKAEAAKSSPSVDIMRGLKVNPPQAAKAEAAKSSSSVDIMRGLKVNPPQAAKADAANKAPQLAIAQQTPTNTVSVSPAAKTSASSIVPQQTAPKPTEPPAPRPLDFGPEPKLKISTNGWQSTGNPLKDIPAPFTLRGMDHDLLYNAYSVMIGAENPSTYENELYQFYKQMTEAKRRGVIVENELEAPTNEEIAKVRRGNYRCVEDMVRDMTINISMGTNQELQKYVVRAFAEVVLDEAKKPDCNLNKATSIAVYLLCWFRRWQGELFSDWQPPALPCFVFLGACRKDKEALFLRMLSLMPVDVLILCPDLDVTAGIEDERIHTAMSLESVVLEHFPKTNANIRVATEGYQAELESDAMLDGMFRNNQFNQARAMTLQTGYHELFDLWNTAIADRMGFDVTRGVVTVPNLFSKVSGVDHENQEAYWLDVKRYIAPDTFVIRRLPFASSTAVANSAHEFWFNGKLNRDRIVSDRFYGYAILRADMQAHLFNKLQEMLDKKVIRGTGQSSVDHAIIAAALSMKREIVRMLQQFDFTKMTPKILVLNTGETTGGMMDAVQLALLNMMGCDILMFVPSGYQCVEQFYNFNLVSEHQIGNYVYDYDVPDFEKVGVQKKGWFDRLIRG